MAIPTQSTKENDGFTETLKNSKQTTLLIDIELRKSIDRWRYENSGSQADVMRWGAELFVKLDTHLQQNDPAYNSSGVKKGEYLSNYLFNKLSDLY